MMTTHEPGGIDRELSILLAARILVQSRLTSGTAGYEELLIDIARRGHEREAYAGLAALAAVLLPIAAAGKQMSEAQMLRAAIAGFVGGERAAAEVPEPLAEA